MNDQYFFEQMGFNVLFRLLTDDIACYGCVFAEFHFDSKGFIFKCQNENRMNQGTGFCYSEGRPLLFDESRKSTETGLYHSQCDTCGDEIKASSVLEICQSCYDQMMIEDLPKLQGGKEDDE